MSGAPCLLALPTLGSLASGIRHIQYSMAVGVGGSFLRKQLLIFPRAESGQQRLPIPEFTGLQS